MKNKLYTIRELTEIISNCQSLNEIQTFNLNMESEFVNYSIHDQGFLLAMIGMAIIRISDGSQNSSLYESKIKLLLLSRISYRDVKGWDTQHSRIGDYEDPYLFV